MYLSLCSDSVPETAEEYSIRDRYIVHPHRLLHHHESRSEKIDGGSTEGTDVSPEQKILSGHHTVLRYPSTFCKNRKRRRTTIRRSRDRTNFPFRHPPFVFFSAATSHNSSHRRFPTRTFAPPSGYLIGSGVFFFNHASILGNSFHCINQNSFYQIYLKMKM